MLLNESLLLILHVDSTESESLTESVIYKYPNVSVDPILLNLNRVLIAIPSIMVDSGLSKSCNTRLNPISLTTNNFRLSLCQFSDDHFLIILIPLSHKLHPDTLPTLCTSFINLSNTLCGDFLSAVSQLSSTRQLLDQVSLYLFNFLINFSFLNPSTYLSLRIPHSLSSKLSESCCYILNQWKHRDSSIVVPLGCCMFFKNFVVGHSSPPCFLPYFYHISNILKITDREVTDSGLFSDTFDVFIDPNWVKIRKLQVHPPPPILKTNTDIDPCIEYIDFLSGSVLKNNQKSNPISEKRISCKISFVSLNQITISLLFLTPQSNQDHVVDPFMIQECRHLLIQMHQERICDSILEGFSKRKRAN
ncbi:hypothetical protein GEMRC1_008438 [Eukaryota sp. GEM-RC1]